MRIPRLFVDINLSFGESVLLPRDQAHHISHVLRMRFGDAIMLFNNSGFEFESIIIELSKKGAMVDVGASRQVENESPLNISLCLAISRAQHMDFSIQKAVELGVKNIVPVMSEYSNVKLQAGRLQNKLTDWPNIIINAAEQCGRNRLTQLQAPVTFSEWLASDVSTTRLILHPGSQQSMSAIEGISNGLTLMIGPEGGFSVKEVFVAQEKGYVSINLGPRILRTETAVVCAVSNAQQLWGDLN